VRAAEPAFGWMMTSHQQGQDGHADDDLGDHGYLPAD
jgi:hypothetical protein